VKNLGTRFGPELRLEDFDYVLPQERIAQEPPADREDARMMVLEAGEAPRDASIRDLPGLLCPGDLVVVNDSRVRPARLLGRKESGGRVEVLLLDRVGEAGGRETWSCLLRASRTPRPGAPLEMDGGIVARLQEDGGGEEGESLVSLEAPEGLTVEAALGRWGRVPLPPYIHRESSDRRRDADRERYQTVFARQDGSAAAPTAGLHFTPGLLAALESAGVETASVTLHVGRGTFQPIRASRIDEHRMHAEWCRLSPETAASLRHARRRGRRILAIGTTTVRTLEARWGDDGPEAGEGPVDLFLRPGHRFRAVDALLTNFHLPRSTLLVMVAAFAGRERILDAYRQAVKRGYRFYSYGDAMLIVP
jgi:S-adenosylmethionine:tRNA ribosyltransferase-isomerase